MNHVIRLLFLLVAFGGIFLIMFFPFNKGKVTIACVAKEPVKPIVNSDDVRLFEDGLLIRYTATNEFYSFVFEFNDTGDYEVRFFAPDNTSLTRSSYLPRDFDRTIDQHTPGLHIAGGILPRHVRMQVTHKGIVKTHDFYNNLSPLNY